MSCSTSPLILPPEESHCSHCKTLLPLSAFPLRAISLTPYSYCHAHSFYWTQPKRKQWAPDFTTSIHGLSSSIQVLMKRGLGADPTNNDDTLTGSWILEGSEDERLLLADSVARTFGRELKILYASSLSFGAFSFVKLNTRTKHADPFENLDQPHNLLHPTRTTSFSTHQMNCIHQSDSQSLTTPS